MMKGAGHTTVISFEGAIINGFDEFEDRVNEAELLADRRVGKSLR